MVHIVVVDGDEKVSGPVISIYLSQSRGSVIRKEFSSRHWRFLEGIVAKYKFGPYLQDSAQWFKIRNRKYSQ